MTKILVTGSAGFIGSRLAEVLADDNFEVLGVDNLNDYYDPAIKLARLQRSGFDKAELSSILTGTHDMLVSRRYPNLGFIRMDIRDPEMELIANEFEPDIIVHFAAQPGVRYSQSHPEECIDNNVLGFMKMIEIARKAGVRRMLYASSSSVYGDQSPHAFRETDSVDSPTSVYAVSKRTNEMLAKVYSEMYGIRMTAMRFFSVYGEWGRPDMAPYLFTDALLHNRPITLFNGGQLSRDFTYIDDVAECIHRIITRGGGVFTTMPSHDTVNIGHGSPTLMLDFVAKIEEITGKKARRVLLPMQHGEVHATLADTSKFHIQYGYYPRTNLDTGLRRFISWFMDYQNISADSVRQSDPSADSLLSSEDESLSYPA